MKEKKNSKGQYIFLGLVILAYIVILILNQALFINALMKSLKIFLKVFFFLVIATLLIAIINYYLKPRAIAKHLGKEAGIKAWLIAIISGIISSGPIYAWYPLLKDLREKGMSDGLIGVFLYNRSVKPALLPLMIYYFGWIYVTLVLIFTILGSIIQGIVIDLLMGEKID